MKFAINKDGSYSHYGTDGTIDFDNIFNESNEPFNHDYINGKWVINEDKEKERVKQEVFSQLEEISKLKLINNTRYSHSDNWKEYDEKYTNEIISLENKLKEM